MESYGESVNYYNGALESAGATQIKYNTWLDSTEAHMNKLKATAETFWMSILNSGVINNFIDAGTRLLSILNVIANNKIALSGAITAITVAVMTLKKELQLFNISQIFKFDSNGNKEFSKNVGGIFGTAIKDTVFNFKMLKEYLADVNKEQSKLGVNGLSMFGKLNEAVRRMTDQTLTARMATIAWGVAGQVANTALTFGLSLAITAIGTWITNKINEISTLRDKAQEMLRNTQQSSQSNNNNIQSLISMKAEYEKLANTSNKTAEQQKRFNEMQNQIAEMSPSVKAGYDEQGNAVVNLKKGIDGLITSLKEENEIENQKLATKGGKDAFKVFQSDIKKSSDALTLLKATLIGYQEQYAQTKAYYDANPEKNNPDDATAQNQLDNLTETQKLIDQTTLSINQANAEIKKQESALAPYIRAVAQGTSGYKDLNKEMKLFIDQQVNGMDFSQFKTWDDATTAIQNIVKAMQSVEGREKFTAIQNLNKDFADGKINADEYEKQLIDLVSTIGQMLGLKAEDLPKLAIQFRVNADSAKKAKTEIKSLQETVEQFGIDMQKASETMKSVNTVLQKHAETGEWDAETLVKIASKYPQVIDAMGDDEKLTKTLVGLKEILNDTAFDAVNKEIEACNAKIKPYLADVDNYETAQKAKDAITEEHVKERLSIESTAFATLQSIINNSYNDAGIGVHAREQSRKMIDEAMSGVYKAVDTKFSLQALVKNAKDYFNNIGDKDYDGRTKKDEQNQIATISRASQFTDIIDTQNDKLAIQDNQIESIKKNLSQIGDDENYTKKLEYQGQLLGELQNKQKMLTDNQSLYSDSKNDIINAFHSKNWLTDVDINSLDQAGMNAKFDELFPERNFGTGDKAEAEKKAYEKDAELFKSYASNWWKFNDALTTTNKSAIEVNDSIVELNQTMEKTKFDKENTSYNKTLHGSQDELEALDNEAKKLEKDDYQGSIEIYRKKMEIQNKDLGAMKAHLKTLKDMPQATKEWRDEVERTNDSIRNQEGVLQDTTNAMKDQAESAVRKLVENEKRLAELRLENKHTAEKQSLMDKNYKVDATEWNAYRDKRIKAINNEIDALKKKQEYDKDNLVIQNSLSAKQQELSTMQERTYESIKDWKDAYTEMHQSRIDAIDAEIDALEKSHEVQEQLLEGENKRLEITKLQDQLDKIRNDRNVQILKQQSDGSWQFEYTYDQQKYDDKQRELTEKQNDYRKWEQDNIYKAQKDALEAQKKYEQDLLALKDNLYSNSLKKLEEAQGKEKDALQVSYDDMDAVVKERMAGMRTEFNDGWDNIVADSEKQLATVKKNIADALAVAKTPIPAPSAPASQTPTSSGGGSSSSYPTNGTSWEQTMWLIDHNGGFNASGTTSSSGGLSMVGEQGRELRVLNQGDGVITNRLTENLMALGENAPSLISNMKTFSDLLNNIPHNLFSMISPLGNGASTPSVSIGNLSVSLPDVTNVDEFVNGLKELPFLAKVY
jgi:hypothetical protein